MKVIIRRFHDALQQIEEEKNPIIWINKLEKNFTRDSK